MNVRVLLTLVVCFSMTGCCLPAFLYNPALLFCPPGAGCGGPGYGGPGFGPPGLGGPPVISPYASGPPNFRSFHDNIVSTHSQSVPGRGFAGPGYPNPGLQAAVAPGPGTFATPGRSPIQRVRAVTRWNTRHSEFVVPPVPQQAPVQCQSECQPQCPPPPQPQCQYQPYQQQPIVATAPVLYAPSYVVAKPRKPPKRWKFPWFSRRTVRESSVYASNYHWLPVVNNDCCAASPCGVGGCTSCAGEPSGCGESVSYSSMPFAADHQLSPIPVSPGESGGRAFTAPAHGKLKAPEIRSVKPEPAGETEFHHATEPQQGPPVTGPYHNGPSAIPAPPEPADLQNDARPGSKPGTSDAINPFGDIEGVDSNEPLPVEADNPQAAYRHPVQHSQPLLIPLQNSSATTAYAAQPAQAVQQTSHQATEWTATTLDRGFFQP